MAYCEKSCDAIFLESLDKSVKTLQHSFFCDHPVGTSGSLKKWKNYDFWRLFLKKIKCQNRELYMTVNMRKVALILKILRTVSHPCWNYKPSNLLFSFSDFCMGHLNKIQTEIAVMLTLPVLESYTKMKRSLKVSKILADPP